MRTAGRVVVPEDPVTDAEARHRRANAFDLSGELVAEDRHSRPPQPGERPGEERCAAPEPAVGAVHGRRMHLDEHLVVPHRRQGHVHHPHHVRRAVPGVDRGQHACTIAARTAISADEPGARLRQGERCGCPAGVGRPDREARPSTVSCPRRGSTRWGTGVDLTPRTGRCSCMTTVQVGVPLGEHGLRVGPQVFTHVSRCLVAVPAGAQWTLPSRRSQLPPQCPRSWADSRSWRSVLRACGGPASAGADRLVELGAEEHDEDVGRLGLRQSRSKTPGLGGHDADRLAVGRDASSLTGPDHLGGLGVAGGTVQRGNERRHALENADRRA